MTTDISHCGGARCSSDVSFNFIEKVVGEFRAPFFDTQLHKTNFSSCLRLHFSPLNYKAKLLKITDIKGIYCAINPYHNDTVALQTEILPFHFADIVHFRTLCFR